MNTHVFIQKQSFKSINPIMIVMLALFAFNSTYAQVNSATNQDSAKERSISGLVSDANGPLDNVNVIQKGTRNGTVTNVKGEFKFPVKLKTGDVLIFSYLGYEKEEVEIKNDTSFIKVVLKEDEIIMIGALDSGKPYKSKRNN